MAWRPGSFLIEGELDNTTRGRVTGWLRFAGLPHTVQLDLRGDFHRDIRGARIRVVGRGAESEAYANYMNGFAEHHTGDVGDMTAGRPPRDYVDYPYFEWYSEENGRVVLELEPDDVELLTQPIPACESDPISRTQQAGHMANFLASLSAELNVPAVAPAQQLVSDPDFTHWVVTDGQVIGEAREVEPGDDGTSFAYVRLFTMPEMAEYGWTQNEHLRAKAVGLSTNSSAADGLDEEVFP